MQGVYPDVSQFNRLLDWLAGEGRFGDVVSLLSDMTLKAGHAPNVNTYRILLNACQRAGQAALALEVYGHMKAKRMPVLQEVSITIPDPCYCL
jgi:pentatricopeptide repeat protein